MLQKTVLGTFGFERTVYGDPKKRREKWWRKLVQEERHRDRNDRWDYVNLLQSDYIPC
jgi:hypothetical protein